MEEDFTWDVWTEVDPSLWERPPPMDVVCRWAREIQERIRPYRQVWEPSYQSNEDYASSLRNSPQARALLLDYEEMELELFRQRNDPDVTAIQLAIHRMHNSCSAHSRPLSRSARYRSLSPPYQVQLPRNKHRKLPLTGGCHREGLPRPPNRIGNQFATSNPYAALASLPTGKRSQWHKPAGPHGEGGKGGQLSVPPRQDQSQYVADDGRSGSRWDRCPSTNGSGS